MKKKLDAAVKAGKLTQAQADEMQARMTEHLDDLVNGTGRGPGGHHRRHGAGDGTVGLTVRRQHEAVGVRSRRLARLDDDSARTQGSAPRGPTPSGASLA